MFSFQHKFSVQVDDVVFHCHRLSARNLRRASEAQQKLQIRNWHEMGADLIEAMRDKAAAGTKSEAAPDAKAKAEARYAQFDPFVVVRLSLEGWSLPDAINDKNIDEIVDALDQKQIDKVSRRVLDESLPPIEPEAQQALEGKDSAPSTST